MHFAELSTESISKFGEAHCMETGKSGREAHI
jgi:hypothetical protein